MSHCPVCYATGFCQHGFGKEPITTAGVFNAHPAQSADEGRDMRAAFEEHCLRLGKDIERDGESYAWVCENWDWWKAGWANCSSRSPAK